LITEIIQYTDKASLRLVASALHDVEVGVHVKDTGLAACMTMMRSDQRVDAIGLAGARQLAEYRSDPQARHDHRVQS